MRALFRKKRTKSSIFMLEKRTNAEAYLVVHGIDKFENDTILDKEADVAEVTFSFPRGRPSASFWLST